MCFVFGPGDIMIIQTQHQLQRIFKWESQIRKQAFTLQNKN